MEHQVRKLLQMYKHALQELTICTAQQEITASHNSHVCRCEERWRSEVLADRLVAWSQILLAITATPVR